MMEFGSGAFEEFFSHRQVTEEVLDFNNSAFVATDFMNL